MKKIIVEIPHYSLTAAITLMLLLYVITFVAGYFLGKKSALEEFADQIKNESFSDKVYASLCSLYEQPGEAIVNTHSSAEEVQETLLEQEENDLKLQDEKNFVAHLIGYGTEKQALAYCKALERKGITASVVARSSVSSKGKKKIWYQVVTAPGDYQSIQNLVGRLCLEDRLAGVSIVEVGI